MGLYSGGAYIWNEVSVSTCGGLIHGGGAYSRRFTVLYYHLRSVCAVFRFDSHSLFASKINKEISYPEQLNLRPFMSKNQGPAVNYKLYAVLVHSGYSCNSGHYYCFIKAANNHWYQMNDSSVSLFIISCSQRDTFPTSRYR